MTTGDHNEAYKRVGRLASLGIEHAWQAALFLPQTYLDCHNVDRSALSLDKKDKAAIRLTLVSALNFGGRSGPPRLAFSVRDGTGAVYKASIFGDTNEWREKLVRDTGQLFLATGHEFGGSHCITIHELLPDKYAGRIIPNYPARRAQFAPEQLRSMVGRLLPQSLATAAQHITAQLEEIAPIQELLTALNARGWTLEQLLQQAHYPSGPQYIEPVRLTLQRLAALGSLANASDRRQVRANPIALPTLAARESAMPFKATNDQHNAIADIAADLASTERPANRVIAGDVGVGKTFVAGVIAAAVADANKRVLVLFPSTIVAGQAHAEFCRWFPDLKITLVTGATGGGEDLSATILMGTSALLHRSAGMFDLVIIDEQHRWSRDQREQYRGAGTHLVEMSATCIPRTQALVRFGHANVSEMRETHQVKFIETQLWVGRGPTKDLMLELRHVIRSGSPVFVVYPKRAKSGQDEDRKNLHSAAELWRRMFPDWVTTLDGTDSADHKQQVIQDVREGRSRILLCTTVVEVGVDVAPLRHIVIVDPQNYSLVQLHQLRGRVARAGGEGWCHLLAPDGIPPRSRERLQPFLDTTDGFKIAEADLRYRGAGDLSSTSSRQHGADSNFLHGIKIPLEVYDEVLPVLQDLKAA